MPEWTPEELVRQQGPAALLEAFTALGGAASPMELRLRTRMAPSTVSKWLAELRSAELVAGPKPKPHLTEQGWTHATRPSASAGAGRRELEAAIDRWPAAGQRAFLRLLVAAVAARWHLGAHRRHRHQAFVVYGHQGTGKSALAEFICRALGLETEAHVVPLAGREAAELLGRRELDPATAEWRYDPSPLLAKPLVVFDGVDDASPDHRRAVASYLQGDTRKVVEGTVVQARAVPMLISSSPTTWAAGPRTVVLDLDSEASELDELDLALRKLEGDGLPPRVDLEALRPSIGRLPPETYWLLRSTLRAGLTPQGWTRCCLEGLELLAIGYTPGLATDADLNTSVIRAAADYLACAATIRQARPG